jgi:hypothetical protein
MFPVLCSKTATMAATMANRRDRRDRRDFSYSPLLRAREELSRKIAPIGTFGIPKFLQVLGQQRLNIRRDKGAIAKRSRLIAPIAPKFNILIREDHDA